MAYNFDVAGAKKQTLHNRRQQAKLNQINQLFLDNAGLEEALGVNNRIIKDMRNKLFTYGSLSDKQISFVFSLAKQRIEYESKSKTVVEGKIEDEFTVISITMKDHVEYMSYSSNSKTKDIFALLQHNDGWKIWGKIIDDVLDHSYIDNRLTIYRLDTKKLKDFNWSELTKHENHIESNGMFYDDLVEYLKGKRVKIKCTVKTSHNDPYFGTFNRMAYIKIL